MDKTVIQEWDRESWNVLLCYKVMKAWKNEGDVSKGDRSQLEQSPVDKARIIKN